MTDHKIDPAHIDALARIFSGDHDECGLPAWTNEYVGERIAEVILTSTDPAVHAAMLEAVLRTADGRALALDALTRHGALKGDFRNLRPCGCRAGMPVLMCCDPDAPTTVRTRRVTEWREVTP